VTEAEWGACCEPQKMLDFLHGRTGKERMLAFLHGRASDRKARLLVVACCRRAWHLLTDERGRRAVEVSERSADGGASREELGTAFVAADQALRTPTEHERLLPLWGALYAARLAAHPKVRVIADGLAHAAAPGRRPGQPSGGPAPSWPDEPLRY
jgi:hypothetical protein